MIRSLVGSVLGVALVVGTLTHCADRVPASVTVPLLVEANRPYVLVTLPRADGSVRTARFLLDTGGGGFLLTEALARDLGVTMGPVSREEDETIAPVTSALSARIGTVPLALDHRRMFVVLGTDNVLAKASAGQAEGMLPGHVLAHYHVVVDYPAGTFTLASPGVLTPRGTPRPMPVSKVQGFPRTEWEIDGTRYGMLLDTGASFSMVSELVLSAWGQHHRDWPRYPGAFGEAATLGGTTLETMFVAQATWNGFPLRTVGVTSKPFGTYERTMSRMMRQSIVGALAGNVLKDFRVELDYANEMLYLSRP